MINERMDYLRSQIVDESISMREILELQDLAEGIESAQSPEAHSAPFFGDVILLTWAGVPEYPEEEERDDMCGLHGGDC